MISPALALAIKSARRQGKRRKAQAVRHPDALEVAYRRYINGVIDRLAEYVNEYLVARLPDMVAERDAQLPTRADSWVDNLENIMGQIQQLADRELAMARQRVLQLGGEISNFNRQQQIAIARATLGVNPFTGTESWLLDELRSFAAENVALIKSVTDQNVIQQIEGIAQRGVRAGARHEDIAKEIGERFGVAKNRAKLIARDQTAKLNGQLNKFRQQEIGIETYIWETSGDEAVRPDHAAMRSRVCRWDDPTVYLDEDSGQWRPRAEIGGVEAHPGEDIQCRCNAAANIESVLQSLGL